MNLTEEAAKTLDEYICPMCAGDPKGKKKAFGLTRYKL
jgi:hypothetical protein